MRDLVEKFDGDRIARFLRNRLGDYAWPVGEAKAKLTKIMAEAKDGRPQVVGLRNPVVMIGMDELEGLVMGLQKPETWGEYFDSSSDESENKVIPRAPSRAGVAHYKMDTTGESSVDEEAESNEINQEFYEDLDLAAAYANLGDSDAASILILEAKANVKARKEPVIQKMLASGTEKKEYERALTSFWKIHPIGSAVECRVLRVAKNRLYLSIDDGPDGVAFIKDPQKRNFSKGVKVRALVVSKLPTEDAIALSLHDNSANSILGGMRPNFNFEGGK